VIRGLLFDLDDTLFDRGVAFAAWADGLAAIQLGRALEPAERAHLVEIDRRGHRSRHEFAADARALGLAIDPEAFPFQLAEHVEPEPGVYEAVSNLARDRRVAIVTNGGPAQRVKLQRIGLDSIVRMVMVSGELDVAKPHPAIYQRALHWSELAPAEVVVVGDHPEVDLAPAAALGMATAWRVRPGVAWPVTRAPPTYRLKRLADLELP